MFVDASAMLAMLTDEPDGDRLARVLEGARSPMTSAIAIYQTAARLMSKSSLSGAEARKTVDDFLRAANIRIVTIGEREAEIALQAFEQFGKRRHPAGSQHGRRLRLRLRQGARRAAPLYRRRFFADRRQFGR